jgi:hypothetical protein
LIIFLFPEDFFRHATAAVRERIFLEQLALIEKHKAWFLRNHISATINVDDHILNLLRQKDIKENRRPDLRPFRGDRKRRESSE